MIRIIQSTLQKLSVQVTQITTQFTNYTFYPKLTTPFAIYHNFSHNLHTIYPQLTTQFTPINPQFTHNLHTILPTINYTNYLNKPTIYAQLTTQFTPISP